MVYDHTLAYLDTKQYTGPRNRSLFPGRFLA